MSEFSIQRLKDDLKRHEGVRSTVYTCPAGKLTIGVGRNLEDRGLLESEIDFLLENDIAECIRSARQLVISFDQLNDVRQEVILNMIFNLGASRFSKFVKTIVAINDGFFEKAAAEMLDSRWATQVGDRAQELAERMRTGHE
ncbi:glycoside hydrolase family protein [Litoribrevibacter albus]|uniref:Lysozyme n=1 Tax=Litoribrevibacter albus TaxID=1473156 RepID=A0AA37S9I4_9GAMM|nr:lysozyme [Litoribrevibacter albus]GLQ31635.1 lysozyme [Litoribrevibacter albus]